MITEERKGRWTPRVGEIVSRGAGGERWPIAADAGGGFYQLGGGGGLVHVTEISGASRPPADCGLFGADVSIGGDIPADRPATAIAVGDRVVVAGLRRAGRVTAVYGRRLSSRHWSGFAETDRTRGAKMGSLAERLTLLLQAVDEGGLMPQYEGSDGEDHYYRVGKWIVCVFDDCGDFDYIDHAISPGGDVIDFDDMPRPLRYYPWASSNQKNWRLDRISRYHRAGAPEYRSLPIDA